MYKRKLLYFGLTTAFVVFLTLVSSAISASITRENLKQSNIAKSLLLEHYELSGISYRLFKQLTDEVIFDQNANQSNVRNKEKRIKQTLATIKVFALDQRTALGENVTKGSLKDIDDIEQLIEKIIKEFEDILKTKSSTPLNEQDRLRFLLENTIDNQFREKISTAVTRQGRVVVAINSKIETITTSMLWFTVGLGSLSLLVILYGCYWLFIQLYQPLILIKNATNAIASGDYNKPITEKLDDEFQAIAFSINQLAIQLKEHVSMEDSSRERLKLEVEKQTSELTKVNLELTKIDARRRQFISDVSHELRTPLTIIRGEAQVTLRMHAANELDYKTALNSVFEQAVNLSRLVDDLLFLTRAEMNQILIDVVETNIKSLVETEVSKWKRLNPNRGINLINRLDANENNLKVDPSRIQQVLSILIDNSIKYSHIGQPIDVTMSEDESKFMITVKDKGKGISATQIENIFERFVRFSKHGEGLGLGLPIAKAIIEAHGGDVNVESTQNEGSIFSITLPKYCIQ